MPRCQGAGEAIWAATASRAGTAVFLCHSCFFRHTDPDRTVNALDTRSETEEIVGTSSVYVKTLVVDMYPDPCLGLARCPRLGPCCSLAGETCSHLHSLRARGVVA